MMKLGSTWVWEATDTAWVRTAAPATACLRFAMLLAVLMAGRIGIEVHPAATAVAVFLFVAYAVLYVAVWAGGIRDSALAQACLLDGFLAGLLLRGAGGQGGPVLSLALLALAVAHLNGGPLLLSATAVSGGAGYGLGWIFGLDSILWSSSVPAGLGGFEVEATYHGRMLVPISASAPPVAQLALGAFAAVCAAIGLLLWQAQRARRRTTRGMQQTEALEAIVDAWTGGLSETAFWQVVLRSAADLTSTRVYAAHADKDSIWVRASSADGENGIDAALRGLRLPRAAENNAVARCFASGSQEEVTDLDDLCAGASPPVAGEVMETARASKPRILLVPVPTTPVETVLLALVRQRHSTPEDALRAVAQRVALVLQAWDERDAQVAEDSFAVTLNFDSGVSA